MKVEDIIQKALNEIGITEYPPNSNNVKYNTFFYGKPVSGSQYAWCCSFVWWILSSCGVEIPKTASCMNMAQWFKSNGKWHTTPQVGDVVFMKFNTNSRWTNHVGLVVDVHGNEITTVEGNTSINSDDNGGAVMKRKRSKNIVGYGRPQYEDAQAVKPEEKEQTQKPKPVLRRGSQGNYVRAWQEYLKTCEIDVGKIDGIYGRKTENGVRQYQKLKHLPITGVVDADDWDSVGK